MMLFPIAESPLFQVLKQSSDSASVFDFGESQIAHNFEGVEIFISL